MFTCDCGGYFGPIFMALVSPENLVSKSLKTSDHVTHMCRWELTYMYDLGHVTYMWGYNHHGHVTYMWGYVTYMWGGSSSMFLLWYREMYF